MTATQSRQTITKAKKQTKNKDKKTMMNKTLDRKLKIVQQEAH